MPAISIILPNYNHAKFLKQRIDSILHQSYTDFEVLIFDDASTDESQEIIKSYTDQRISLVEIAKTNSGSPFGSWQKGILNSKAPLIWIAESDDYADPDFLLNTIAAFKKNPDNQIVFCASHWVNSLGEIIHTPEHENGLFEKKYSEILFNEFLKGPLIYNASSAVFKKENLKNLDFEKLKSFKYTGDWYFWSSFEESAKVTRLPLRLNFFRRHDNNVSFQAEKDGLDIIEGTRIVGSLLEMHKTPFAQRQKTLAYWALKVYRSSLLKKRKYLASLPFEAKIWYFLTPILAKFY